ncbi:N-acyl-D-amino-acid deacylase family protein [Candidatus Binatus sp.]|jgi:N-acyl-D-amino-acid deacylase|uniref:N-acyl-D-amino-acid deacylase family protein n=1 Tax=Candidatus Binatus sp. TaxID=2811406 RepID=UPI003F976151
MEYDVVVLNGVVVDGSGAPRFRGDVAIKDRKIAALIDPADAASASAAREIDATGLAIAPGFIDMHSHSDWVVPVADHGKILKPFLLQGVTTFVGGNCGFSVAPVMRERNRMLDESGRLCAERKFDWEWEDVAGFAAYLKRRGLALNVAHLAGHGSIRLSVMGSDAGEPSAQQLRAMQAMVEGAMADGAVGLSCGLGYFPGMIAKPAELAALARVAAAAGGVLTSHLRAYTERSLFFDSRAVPHNILAVREMANVAREAGVPLQVSHLIFVGPQTWATVDDTIAEVERHKSDGVDIAFDTFPYTCGNTTIRVIFPAWAQTGLEGLLDSKDGWAKLRAGFRPLAPFIADAVQLMWAVKPELSHLEGKFFGQIADELKLDPIDAYLTITRESGTRARVLNHLYSGDDYGDERALREAMKHPLNMFEMDTILTSYGHHNPASFGTYPRILGHYVRELKLLTLEDAVHKATGMAAKRMRLGGRGLVRPGYAADLVIFNPETIGCAADSRTPTVAPVGIEHVMVNASAVVADGKWCGDGVMAGEWISRG